eukprot:scaffold11731_cov74-Skeletonema_dohrnii-CCMP3373.AAC.3
MLASSESASISLLNSITNSTAISLECTLERTTREELRLRQVLAWLLAHRVYSCMLIFEADEVGTEHKCREVPYARNKKKSNEAMLSIQAPTLPVSSQLLISRYPKFQTKLTLPRRGAPVVQVGRPR